MQNSQLNRIIKLIKRTGDKTVIVDNESDAVMMLMDLNVYEKMLDRTQGVEQLTEEELLEKINRDVAVWRASNEKERPEIYDDEVLEKPQNLKSTIPPEFSSVEKERAQTKEKSLKLEESNTVSPDRYHNAEHEQSASDILAEEEEEKFYLEPVE